MAVTSTKIPKGYKQTDVGVIPEAWDIVSYGQAFDFLRTALFLRDQLGDGRTKYVHYGDIHTKWDFFVDLQTDLPTITDDKAGKFSLIEDGDLIMADAAEDYEGGGKSGEVLNRNGG